MNKKKVWKYLMPGSGDIMKINGLENETVLSQKDNLMLNEMNK